MATEIDPYAQRFTGVAAVDFTAATKPKFVKSNGTSTGLGVNVTPVTGVTDIPVGVIQENPAAGDIAGVCCSGICKVLVGTGGATVGHLLELSADADGTVCDANTAHGTQYVLGQALQTGVAGDVIKIRVGIVGRNV